MIKSKTVFIVGAGASQEVGLPTGAELKNKIAQKLDLRYEFGSRITGDYQIEAAFRDYVRRESPSSQDINPYLRASRQIRDILPQALSIDNILDAHSGDEKINLCGKIGIVKTILEAENNSRIANTGNYLILEDTWYAQFLKLVTENVRKENLEELFTNVSFITFNYDRCIEQYLVLALSNYYAITEIESQKLVNTLVIEHPYGQVGMLPFQDPGNYVKYGETEYLDLLSISSGIKTFTEQESNDDKLTKLRDLIVEAETVVFIGFAFHELNMQLLDPQKSTNTKRVFATAKGISDSDCLVIIDDIQSILRNDIEKRSIIINNRLTCCELFETHWRSLSR